MTKDAPTPNDRKNLLQQIFTKKGPIESIGKPIEIPVPTTAPVPETTFNPLNMPKEKAQTPIEVPTTAPVTEEVLEKVENPVEEEPEIVPTKSVTRKNAISIITEKLPGRENYFYQSDSFEFSLQDLRAINPLVNLGDMVEVLSNIEDTNLPVNGLVMGIIGNAIIERIRANQQTNPTLTLHLSDMLSREFWMGIDSENEEIPPELEPALNFGAFVKNKLQSGQEILAIESQSSLGGWNTDLLFTALSSLHNRIVASCRNEGTETEELSQFNKELDKHRRTTTSLDPDSSTLLQNIKYLLQGHK